LQQCFLLADNDSAVNVLPSSVDGENIVARWICRDELAANDDLLQAIFRLLVDAHYRTEPDDLRYLLDVPDISLVIGLHGDNVVAVALIADEKSLPVDIIERIKTDKHRPRGHLLAQTLALQDGIYDALPMHAWRIVRIAVQVELQGSGIGKQLLSTIADAARNAGVDYLGSSFAIDTAVFAFWLRAGFVPLRIGLHCDHVTASYAALVALPFSAAAKALQLQRQQRFARQLPQLLAQYWYDLEPEIIVRLYQQLPCVLVPSEIDLQQTCDYLRGAIGYDAAWLSLSAVLQQHLHKPVNQSDEKLVLPVRRILQSWSWDRLVKTGAYSGKKSVEVALRDNLEKIIFSGR
jgi:tRNA(Met) cytidine acetyltransferase